MKMAIMLRWAAAAVVVDAHARRGGVAFDVG